MKRLGVYAFIAIVLLSGGLGFSTPKALAQTTGLPSGGTYDYFMGVVTGFHNTALQAYESVGARSPNDAATLRAVENFKTVSQSNYDAYVSAFNAAKNSTPPATPAQAQIKGIQAWVASRDLGSNLTITQSVSASSPIKTAYNQYSTTVSRDALTAAINIDRGNTTAGSAETSVTTGSASTITNAASGNTNATTQTRDDNPDSCSLLSGNLVGCIDSIVAWIIKHTLLQLAGFLVWLSANMLNLAIQVSILDFAKWAPASLYPIWVIIRQIVSLVIVFAGLYLGFMYIIGREATFGRYVGWLVIFAIFVNFSYPVARALTDVSNIISLNVYSSAVGTAPIEGSGAATAGGLIMDRLGLNGLVASATASKSSFIASINSTPGALLAVIFVLYAAYVFLRATIIIATRTAVLVFLIVASPLLLVDSVIPKFGEVAMKMRKMFFEQLVVAPVFMIMLALTLKFMEVFQEGGVLSAATGTAGALQASSGDASIRTFFSILVMLIMLHIMLKVTVSLSGDAGKYATNIMGKVGGFGLGVASAGTGLLARGTIGAAASRLQNSAWMDKMQGSRTGRGLYNLTNSLAQSTFDTRNIGMISKGMASAGMGMGTGSTQTYQKNFTARQSAVTTKYESIKDDKARAAYYENTKNSTSSKVGRTLLGGKSDGDLIAEKLADSERNIQNKRNAALAAFTSAKPEDRSALIDSARDDKVLQDKLNKTSQYLAVDSKNDPEAVKKKVAALTALGDSDMAKKVIDNDPFKDITDAYDKEIKAEEEALETMDKTEEVYLAGPNGVNRKTTKYEQKRKEIAQKKADQRKEIEDKRKELLNAYRDQMNEVTAGAPDLDLTDNELDPLHPGGSDMSYLEGAQYAIPAVQRKGGVAPETPGFLLSGQALKNYNAERKAREAADEAIRNAQKNDPGAGSPVAPARQPSPSPAGSAVTT